MRRRLVPFALSLGISCLVSVPAQANPLYDVTGELTIPGSSTACGGPCVETMDFSFQIDAGFFDTSFYNAYTYIITASQETASGPIGQFHRITESPSFGGISVPSSSGAGDSDFIPYADSGGDEIDIHLLGNLQSVPTAPTIGWVDLFTCRSALCAQDFPGPGEFGLPQHQLGTVEYTVTAVSEPEYPWLIAGMVSLVGIIARLRPRITSALN
jgi:hypothetical protein